MASTFKYVMLLGDFNAHHHAWRDVRIDHQEDLILQVCDNYQIILLNDGALTFVSSAGTATSSIDLTIVSHSLGMLSIGSTLSDLHGSDHFPISVTISDTSFCYSHKLKLTDVQLSSLYFRLFNNI